MYQATCFSTQFSMNPLAHQSFFIGFQNPKKITKMYIYMQYTKHFWSKNCLSCWQFFFKFGICLVFFVQHLIKLLSCQSLCKQNAIIADNNIKNRFIVFCFCFYFYFFIIFFSIRKKTNILSIVQISFINHYSDIFALFIRFSRPYYTVYSHCLVWYSFTKDCMIGFILPAGYYSEAIYL